MRNLNLLHRKVFGVPLWAIGLCGLVGMAVDLDHPIAYYLLQNWSGRFLHTPLAVASCLVLCGIGAHCARLYRSLVLRRNKR